MENKKADATSNVADAHDQANATDEIPALTSEERHQRIAKAAYLRAAARDFVGGDPLQDWLAAEAEINAAVERESGRLDPIRLPASTRGSIMRLLSEKRP